MRSAEPREEINRDEQDKGICDFRFLICDWMRTEDQIHNSLILLPIENLKSKIFILSILFIPV